MKSHLAEDIRIARPRFHLQTRDGLYAPIAFLFVTERMRDDILHERELLVATLPPAQRARQLIHQPARRTHNHVLHALRQSGDF